MKKICKPKKFHEGLKLILKLNFSVYLLSIVLLNVILPVGLVAWSILSASFIGLYQFIYIISILIRHIFKNNEEYFYGTIAGAILTLTISVIILIGTWYVATHFFPSPSSLFPITLYVSMHSGG